ncbi:hypothetical protein [Candidiatus Paracoxiella cheracis]|uniref:hypothetical protein n=1 Tax=Candidiatus Paracoxiella cheracis TaxID=3405120 RepID=UPI003BF60094
MNNQLLQVYQPQNFDDAKSIAEMLAKTSFVPKEFRGKPAEVFCAMVIGANLGLDYVQSLQNIAFINGRYCIWGDTLLALVKSHPEFEDIQETIKNNVATCTVKRKNQSPHTKTFSKADAERAGLWGKNVWLTYPERMLQMRARAFAIRDVFPDALKGLQVREEVEDYRPIKNVASTADASPAIEATYIDESVEPVTPNESKANARLQQLIKLHRIHDSVVQRWIDAAHVSSINELNAKQTQGCLNWIDKKYPEKTVESTPVEKPVDRAQALVDELKAKDSSANTMAKAA